MDSSPHNDRLISFMQSRFGDLRDGSGTLISDHAIRVQQLLAQTFQMTGRPLGAEERAMLDAALCHDLLEDTSTTEAELIELTSVRAVALIRELTVDFANRPLAATVREMEERSEESFVIKLCDIADNFGKTRYVFRNNDPTFLRTFLIPLMHEYQRMIREKRKKAVSYKDEVAHLSELALGQFDLLSAVLNATRFC